LNAHYAQTEQIGDMLASLYELENSLKQDPFRSLLELNS
jgi:hypothetical protein